MVLDDIVGQKNIVRDIKNSLLNKRIAHAYLFCGPDGVGKSIAASILAMTLNCKAKGLDPCGRCPSCIRAQSGNHPDIIHFRAKNRSGSKQSISVDDIRDLQADMQKKPYENGVKVYIIHDAEKMTEQAQNALLKVLEEPPEKMVIILLTYNMYSILSTIISRCRVMKFTRAPERDIEAYLIDKAGVSAEQARYLAALSDGILKNALDFMDSDDLKAARNEIIELSRNIKYCDKIDALYSVEYFINNKDGIDKILDIMMSFYRDMMIFKECADKRLLINLDKAGMIQDECPKYTVGSLYNIIKSIKETARKIRLNVNYQLAIESMLLNIWEG
ncbi:MAG TPA: DNA polymerase III subunit delta' [Clostridiaceae bacterium]|nr:DNA polymerase III subunit delta' [Clostridiaceae bacterium]